MKPKPHKNFFLNWLLPFWLLVFFNPLYLIGQGQSDSTHIFETVNDSLHAHSNQFDSLELNVDQTLDSLDVLDRIDGKIDSVFNTDKENLSTFPTLGDTLNNHLELTRVLPKISDLGPINDLIDIKNPINEQKISIPKGENLKLNKIESAIPPVHKEVYSKLKSDVIPHIPSKQEMDSLSFKLIEEKAEELAIDNIEELQQLNEMEGAANEASSKLKDFEWDKSKIKSSKNVSKVLSENVESIQTGMDKMNDIEGKYSKFNLLNSNGPVLKEISISERDTLQNFQNELDSVSTEFIEKEIKNNIEEETGVIEELEAATEFDTMQIDFPFQNPENYNWDPAKIANSEEVKNFIGKNSKKIREATERVDKLKKKYSQYHIGDSSNSLMEKRIPEKRWQFQLNLQTTLKPQFNLKVGPSIAYRLGLKYTLGFTSAFDYNYHYKDTTLHSFNDELSFRVFNQFKIFNDLFIQGEIEQPFRTKFLKNEDGYDFKMLKKQTRFWIGGGIEYNIYKKLRGQTQLLYNVRSTQQTNDVANRWALRINLVY